MNCPIPGASRTCIQVWVREPVIAKNIDNPLRTVQFLPRLDPYRAHLTLSDNKVEWLVIEGGGSWYGWPKSALEKLVDDDKLRLSRGTQEITVSEL